VTARPTPVRHAAILAAFLAVAWLIYAPIFGVAPISGDNFYVLSWVDRAPASSLLAVDPAIYPEWRPLAYLTIWLQYALVGFDRVADYYIVNIALWALAAWLVYRIVLAFTTSDFAAVASGLFVLVDVRAVPPVAWIVGRQGTMACVFGLLAVWLVVRAGARPTSARERGTIGLLLAASALSKEYGLAFSGALALHALLERRFDVLRPAVVAVAAYGALRLTLAGGATAPYCQDMGYFFTLKYNRCLDGVDAASLAQMTYNVAATAVGSTLRGVLDTDGRLGIARLSLLLSAVWLCAVVVGWVWHRRASRLGLSILLANAALSVLLYQPRNQVVAICGIGIAAGLGLAAVQSMPRNRRAAMWAHGALAMAAAGLLSLQAVRTYAEVRSEVARLKHKDPCAQVAEHPELKDFVDRLDDRYTVPRCGPAPVRVPPA